MLIIFSFDELIIYSFLCPAALVPPPTCPQGWYEVNGKCYHVSVDPSGYMDAYMTCALAGADLISFASAADEASLADE